jgi:uncharacterized 2Fe-2S/4Fe-4S cluster protein (DUF4445 family)
MPVVTIIDGENKKSFSVQKGERLLSLLQRNQIEISAPCGGRGTCGKCSVLLDGKKVLACQASILTDCTISLPRMARASVLAEGLSRPCREVSEKTGIAFDLGTTTVAGRLVQKGSVTCQATAENAQKVFGADVVSRLQYALEHGQAALQEAIVHQLDSMIESLCREGKETVETVVVVGNPTMLHLLLGENISGLARAPFAPAFLGTKTIQGKEIGFTHDIVLHLLPSISAYVGGDITAAMLACSMDREDRLCLLIDIGTNGELVLGNRHGFTCTSVAAGPAFEGAQITCGMSGVDGAISKVKLSNGMVEVTTIGQKPSEGICGSGLLDAVAQMLEVGILDPSGRIKEKIEVDAPFRRYVSNQTVHLTPRVSLTQQDIRQVQYAKAAIAAGVRTLLEESGHTMEEVECVYLAGGMGSFLSLNSAIRIGLLPDAWRDRIVVCGNAALSGSVSAVKEPDLFLMAEEIRAKATVIELADCKQFEEYYIKEMMF